MNKNNPRITGTQIHYFYVCHRKLWLFSHHIQMEQESDVVRTGKVLHETSYTRKKKEILIDGIKIDFMDAQRGLIHEVKKSKALNESHVWQMKYYLYYLKNLGVDVQGMIDYPLLRRREPVILSEKDIEALEGILREIEAIISDCNLPDVIDEKYCKKCSYYDLCYI